MLVNVFDPVIDVRIICCFSCLNANRIKTFRSVFLSNLGFNSGQCFYPLDIAGADPGCGGGGGVLGGYSTPFRTATKTYNAWENKRKCVGHKNLVKPTSLTNAAAIDRNVVCQKFVVLHPRRMMASSLLAD